MAPNRMFQQLTDKTKKKKHRPFYEAVNAHARRHLNTLQVKLSSVYWLSNNIRSDYRIITSSSMCKG